MRPFAVARSRCRMGMQAPTSICSISCSISKDDIDLVTGMTRYSAVPVSPAPGVTLLRGDLVRLDGNKWTPRQR